MICGCDHHEEGESATFFRRLKATVLLASREPVGLSDTSDQSSRQTLRLADKVLNACPDGDWRLIFALCRFGGLRCPSEVSRLRLNDVDWGRDRFLVHSPKTEHHEGKASRWVPIFPELRPHLEEAWETAEPGQESNRAHERDEEPESLAICASMRSIAFECGLTEERSSVSHG